MEERSTLVSELTQELTRVAPREPFPLRLCRAFTRFASADGGAISLGFETGVDSLPSSVSSTLIYAFPMLPDHAGSRRGHRGPAAVAQEPVSRSTIIRRGGVRHGQVVSAT